MEIRKKFDDLIPLMEDAFLAEKLISKRIVSISSTQKVTDIQISNENISCIYNIDRKYKVNLSFVRLPSGYIDFVSSTPSIFYMLLIGGIFGFRMSIKQHFNAIFGVLIGVTIFLFFNFIVNKYLQRKLWDRINERWSSVISNKLENDLDNTDTFQNFKIEPNKVNIDFENTQIENEKITPEQWFKINPGKSLNDYFAYKNR